MNTAFALGAAGCVAVTCAATASFLGVSGEPVEVTIEGTDYTVWRLYANFDDPDDQLIGIGGGRQSPLTIEAGGPSGFYQHLCGSTTPPSQVVIELCPDVVYDSFVTIGVTDADSQTIPLVLVGFDNDGFNNGGSIFMDNGTWGLYATIPDPKNPGRFIPTPETLAGPEGRVLFAQFTVDAGAELAGTLGLIETVEGGEAVLHAETFSFVSLPCPADVDGDRTVGFSDLLVLLGAWGPCPSDGACPADLDGNLEVGFSDLLAMLGDWGPC